MIMKRIACILTPLVLLLVAGCKDYLDIVPDNVATIDNAFADRTEAEKYLFTCYSFIPQDGHPDTNPGFNAGDECWIYWPIDNEDYWSLDPYSIARGLQNKVSPYVDYWDGYDTPPLWQGIRDCNIFLENIDRVPDVEPYTRARWVAEAKFLKAYLHWYLFRMYGPIPIVDKNLSVAASTSEVKVMQQPVDSVVNYIAALLDSAAAGDANNGLPDRIQNETTELGRITRPAVLAIKARLLVTAASPLFNGNSDYTGFVNKAGTPLFNPNFDPQKWERAAEACKAAIEACEAAGIQLYHFDPKLQTVTEAERQEMTIRGAVTEKWNEGLVWGSTIKANATNLLQLYACPQLDPNNINLALKGQLAPTMKMAELFYTNHGVPIDQDKTWDYANRFKLRTATSQDSMLQNNYTTVGLHFDREPRFYADIAFDGALWFMQNQRWPIQAKSGQPMGKKQSRLYSVTGYFCKKLVNWNLVVASNAVTVEVYPWPVMRLADLYLLYAEALNESGHGEEAIQWLDRIRERAGLQGVKASWDQYARDPNRYATKEGLRSIIHRERLIEMAFEGSRFWDLRRWKEAARTLNEPIFGWDITQSAPEDYYRKLPLFNQRFVSPRDYLWPIKEDNLTVNSNLVQNPGW